jgi:hypothetical protein
MGGILGSLLGAQSATSRGSLASDLSALSSAGRSGFDAITGTVPGQSAMLEELNRQIYGDLQAGAELDPRDRYRLMQESRAAGASRGMGFGPSDSAAETMALWLGGEDLKRRRQEAAQKQAGLNFGLVTDPMLGMLDRGTDVFGLATQLGMSQIPNLDPFNAYASDLYNTNYNAAWANVLNSRNNAAARSAANKAMIGQIVGGVLGGAAGAACYLAREVFGEESPRWREFRTWLLGYAPPALRAWYLDNAAAVARLVRDLPRVKDDLRRWMTAKIEEVPHAV